MVCGSSQAPAFACLFFSFGYQTFSSTSINSPIGTGPRKIHVPKAPPLGLLLEQPLFHSYNDTVEKGQKFMAAKDTVNFEQYREKIDAFKMQYIYEALRKEEEETDT